MEQNFPTSPPPKAIVDPIFMNFYAFYRASIFVIITKVKLFCMVMALARKCSSVPALEQASDGDVNTKKFLI
jgi:hypothetical protein